jgi:hypothetical protein
MLVACVDRSSTAPSRGSTDGISPTSIPGTGRGGTSSKVAADASVEQQLAALRGLTARFHRIEAARAAGWTVTVPPCRDNPPQGGMGWHFLNPANVSATPEVLKPQVVIYEPEKNGDLRLVGIEYIVPFSIVPSTATPPTLLGQQFVQNFGDQVWMLHVWVWKHNHDGMFATWNPSVSCQYAGATP